MTIAPALPPSMRSVSTHMGKPILTRPQLTKALLFASCLTGSTIAQGPEIEPGGQTETPVIADFTGTWDVSATIRRADNVRVGTRMQGVTKYTQEENQVSGTSSLENQVSFGTSSLESGRIESRTSGWVDGRTLRAEARSTGLDCPWVFQVELTLSSSGDLYTGSYVGRNCSGFMDATIVGRRTGGRRAKRNKSLIEILDEGELLLQAGAHEDALVTFREAQRKADEPAYRIQIGLARSLLRGAELEEGVKELEKLIELEGGETPEVLLELAGAYLDLVSTLVVVTGRRNLSADCGEPRRRKPTPFLLSPKKRTVKLRDLETMARRILELSEDANIQADAYNFLGFSFFKKTARNQEDLKEAERAFRNAVQITQGESASLRYNLMSVLLELGDVQQAASTARALLAELPDAPATDRARTFLCQTRAAHPEIDPPRPQTIRNVADEVQAPVVLNRVQPQYTKKACAKRFEGDVLLRTTTDEEGCVIELEVLKGLPHGLDEAAIGAIRRTAFRPAMLQGKPVAVYFNVRVPFRVRD